MAVNLKSNINEFLEKNKDAIKPDMNTSVSLVVPPIFPTNKTYTLSFSFPEMKDGHGACHIKFDGTDNDNEKFLLIPILEMHLKQLKNEMYSKTHMEDLT